MPLLNVGALVSGHTWLSWLLQSGSNPLSGYLQDFALLTALFKWSNTLHSRGGEILKGRAADRIRETSMNVKLFLFRSKISGESNQSKKESKVSTLLDICLRIRDYFSKLLIVVPPALSQNVFIVWIQTFLLAGRETLSRNGIHFGWNRADLSWGRLFSPLWELLCVSDSTKTSQHETTPWHQCWYRD